MLTSESSRRSPAQVACKNFDSRCFACFFILLALSWVLVPSETRDPAPIAPQPIYGTYLGGHHKDFANATIAHKWPCVSKAVPWPPAFLEVATAPADAI